MSAPVPSVVPPLTAPRRARKLTLRRAARSPTACGWSPCASPGFRWSRCGCACPFLSAAPSHPARAALLSDGVLTGAGGATTGPAWPPPCRRSAATSSVGVDADRLLVSGNVLATGPARRCSTLVAACSTEPTYRRATRSATERDRLVEKLTIARSRPGVIAAEALAPAHVGRASVRASTCRSRGASRRRPQRRCASCTATCVRPDGATLVVVGDVSPARALDQVEPRAGRLDGHARRGARVPRAAEPPSARAAAGRRPARFGAVVAADGRAPR